MNEIYLSLSSSLPATFVRRGESLIGKGKKIHRCNQQATNFSMAYIACSIIFQRLSTAVIVPIQSVLIFSGR